ncbi:toxin [Bacillus salitolerans]|uniref:Toxin n=1 Tax=Bacillus salitolerans TaxID=1437434 RepID=A0ABW4LW57_9BACI
MKKMTFSLLIIMFLFIPVVTNNKIEASQGGHLLKYNEQLSTELLSIEHIILLEEIIVLPNESFYKDDAIQMIENVSKIHPNILKKTVENKVKLKLFTGSLTDQPGLTHLKGIMPKGYVRYTWDDVPGAGGAKMAYAKIGHSHKGKGHGSINLELHELAHSIDNHVFNSLRDDQEFLKIWKEESSVLFPDQPYFINHVEEYFAEVFAMYYLSFFTQTELYIHAPKTYYYLQQLEAEEPFPLEMAMIFH